MDVVRDERILSCTSGSSHEAYDHKGKVHPDRAQTYIGHAAHEYDTMLAEKWGIVDGIGLAGYSDDVATTASSQSYDSAPNFSLGNKHMAIMFSHRYHALADELKDCELRRWRVRILVDHRPDLRVRERG